MTTPFPQYPGQPEQQPPVAEPPLWAAWYGIGMTDAVRRFFKKGFEFKGFASRGEYWWVTLAIFLASSVLGIFTSIIDISLSSDIENPSMTFTNIFSLALFIVVLIPSLALTWRRLHDAGLAGSWALLMLIPFLGSLAVFVMTLLPTNPARHKVEWAAEGDPRLGRPPVQ